MRWSASELYSPGLLDAAVSSPDWSCAGGAFTVGGVSCVACGELAPCGEGSEIAMNNPTPRLIASALTKATISVSRLVIRFKRRLNSILQRGLSRLLLAQA
jgi:hypothetical protein